MRGITLKFAQNWLLPPMIVRAYDKTYQRLFGTSLDTLRMVRSDAWSEFRRLISDSNNYGEYGSGESTLYAALHSAANVRTVETDATWIARIESRLNRPIDLLHVNLGEVGRWGTPISYDYRLRFSDYVGGVFASGNCPDLVLIDGRFRVACFLTCLLQGREGLKIVFDDYVNRRYYHVVEEVLAPEFVGSRQAIFTRPREIDRKRVEELLSKFEYVFD